LPWPKQHSKTRRPFQQQTGLRELRFSVYYAASRGNSSPTFRENLSVHWPLEMGLIGCSETSIRNYHYSLLRRAQFSATLRRNLKSRKLELNLQKKLLQCYIGSVASCGAETATVLHWERSFVWCWNSDSSVSRSDIAGTMWNVVLQKDAEDHFNRSCGKWRSMT
jgi:hypothetical protein